MHARKERAAGQNRSGGVLIKVLVIPARGHTRREERLDLRGKIKHIVMNRVVERLDSEPIAHRKQEAIGLVPQNKSEFTAKLVRTIPSELLVEMQCDLAVRLRPEAVTALLQFATLPLKIIELAVHNDVNALIFICDRLIPAGKVDDAQTGMAKADTVVGRQPHALMVRPAMDKRIRGAPQGWG
jgi:hypothetical protein